MALSTLYNTPENDEQFNVFSFANQDEHNKIAMALVSQYNVEAPSYVIDPIPLQDPGTWLEQHQILHNVMNSVTGQASNDLTTVDFSDESQRNEWFWLHAQEHYKVASVLGLQ